MTTRRPGVSRSRWLRSVGFPPMNVFTGTDGAFLTAEVPGVRPDQIDVIVRNETVTLQGSRDPEKIEGDVIVHRRERPHRPFSRTLALPMRIDAERVSARFDHGVLTVDLPRPAADRPRRVAIRRAGEGSAS